MSGLITSTTIALTTVATVMAASFPEVAQSIAPIFDTTDEYTAVSMGILISIPGLALLTILASAARD